jgi:hypothetical protein
MVAGAVGGNGCRGTRWRRLEQRQGRRGEGPNLGAAAGHRSLASEGRRQRSLASERRRRRSLASICFSSEEEAWSVSTGFRGRELGKSGGVFTRAGGVPWNWAQFPRYDSEANPNGGNWPRIPDSQIPSPILRIQTQCKELCKCTNWAELVSHFEFRNT